MAKYDTGGHFQEILPVFRPFAIYLYRFFTVLKLNQHLFMEGIDKLYRRGTVLFPGTDQFSVPYSPKRRGIGTKIEGLKKVGLSLSIFAYQKNIFSRGIDLPIRKIPKSGGPQGPKQHGISAALPGRLIKLHGHYDMEKIFLGGWF
jgi:hypothetical protein